MVPAASSPKPFFICCGRFPTPGAATDKATHITCDFKGAQESGVRQHDGPGKLGMVETVRGANSFRGWRGKALQRHGHSTTVSKAET